MLTMDHKAKIRHIVLVEGKSQRQVAKETGHSRNTIKKMLQDSETPRATSKRSRGLRRGWGRTKRLTKEQAQIRPLPPAPFP